MTKKDDTRYRNWISTNEKRLLYEIIQQIQFLNRYNVTAHTIWRVSYH